MAETYIIEVKIQTRRDIPTCNAVGRALIAQHYVRHSIDPKTKKQIIRLTAIGEIALELLAEIADTTEKIEEIESRMKEMAKK